MVLMTTHVKLSAQVKDSIINLTGIVYDSNYIPVPASHVINLNTHQGEVTDSLGIFRIPVSNSDTLLILNIAYQDTWVPVSQITDKRYVIIERKFYQLQEAKIFDWGSSYIDFKEAMIEMPKQQTLGETMGLPMQDPDYIPYDMDEEALKSVGFLLTSPISYLYHNFNKQAQSARKVYWLKKNQAKHSLFDEIMGAENISNITDLTGKELQDFIVYLYQRLVCDFKCTEIQLYTEIHEWWKTYQRIGER